MEQLELSQLKHLRKTMTSQEDITTDNNKISYQLVA
jgi:hypothetical protein